MPEPEKPAATGTTASGILGLLGLFAGLCAAFAFAVTLIEGSASPRLRSNIEITLIAALACAVLLPVARWLAKHEKPAPNPGELSPAGRLAWGAFCAAIGLFTAGTALHQVLGAPQPLLSESFVGVPAGLIFVFGGALLALPTGRPELARLLATLVVTMFAVAFDWVAFGPGERHFSGGISFGVSSFGLPASETFGRAMFGLFALVLDVVALAMWAREAKAMLLGR
ncbi:MAG: hypothetical protein JO035_07890 [Betaproteobacteria bacterium]|nr:hypothetical protein [Betaproteobacteria bacterium]